MVNVSRRLGALPDWTSPLRRQGSKGVGFVEFVGKEDPVLPRAAGSAFPTAVAMDSP